MVISCNSEKIDTIELGLKASYWGNKASTNFSVFRNEITDFQVPQFGGLAFQVLTASGAENYGAEIENNFVIGDSVSLLLAATWIPHAEIDKDSSIEVNSAGQAISGQRFILTPKLSALASLNLDKPINDSLAVTGRVSVQHTSEQRTNSTDLPTTVNGSLRVSKMPPL